jgi:hypothetical protein
MRAIIPLVKSFGKVVEGMVEIVTGLLHGDFSKVWDGIKKTISGAFSGAKKILQTQAQILGTVALSIGKAVLNGIVNGLKGLGEKLAGFIIGPINALIRQANRFLPPGIKIPEIGPGGPSTPATQAGSPAHTGTRTTFPRPGGRDPVTGAPKPGPVPGPSGRSLSFRSDGGVTITGPVHVNGVQNPREFLRELQAIARTKSSSRSGQFGGLNLGLS